MRFRPGFLLIAALVCCQLGGCDTAQLKLEVKSLVSRFVRAVAEPLVSDLDEARMAMSDREWNRAEKHLERFLREAQDPEERWEAWQKLIEATERGGQDKRWINDYLETMLMEFRDNPERQRTILRFMAENQEAARDYNRAIASWTQLVSLPGLPDQDKLEIYTRLAHMQMRNRQLQGAEGTLHECLSLSLPDTRKVECYYDMAELSVLRDELDEGAATLGQILEMHDIPTGLQARTVFLLADILQQQQKNQEALQLFESVRDSYPNYLAVEARIAFLKKRLKSP